ncbi:MFS transporter [Cysteiniphilum sp. 19S12-1]|uniref:MFS transporter n=1 Tax=Cysteiniphilum sp. 19S12-1 TaxID=3453130 RepID=UPI003F84F2FC
MLLVIMLFNMMLAFMASDMYLPAIPVMGKLYGVTITYIQFTITLYFIGMVIANILTGCISDGIGRKKALMMSHIIFFMGNALCICFNHFTLFLLGRLLQGIGSGGLMGLSRVIISESYPQDELKKIFSIFALMFGVLPAIAPLSGALIMEATHWQAIFYSLLFAQIICFLVTQTMVRETHYDRRSINIVHGLYYHFKHSSVLLKNAMGAAVVFMGAMAMTAIGPIYFEKLNHFTFKKYGLTVLLIVLLGQLGKIVNIVFTNKVDHYLFRLGLFLLLMAALLLANVYLHVTKVSLFCLAFVLYINSMGLLLPIFVSKAMNSITDYKGSASSIYGTFLFLGGALGTFAIIFFTR